MNLYWSIYKRSLIGCVVLSAIALASLGKPQATPPNTSIDFTYPLGYSPMVFTNGWKFGGKCIYKGKDLSSKIKWSGTATFTPAVGPESKPVFKWPGMNTITLTVMISPKEFLRQTMMVHAVSSDGYAAVGDQSYCAQESHGVSGDPRAITGAITTGSPDVLIRKSPAARMGDVGKTKGCSGANTFEIAEGDPLVLIKGRPAARQGDRTKHCGGAGAIKGEKPRIPVYKSDMKQIVLPNGDLIVFSDLKWWNSQTFSDGKVKVRNSRTQKHDVNQTYNQNGICTRMTFEVLLPGEASFTYVFNFHDTGEIKSFVTWADQFGGLSTELSWYPSGALQEIRTYQPWMKINGRYEGNGRDYSMIDERYEDGEPKYKVIRDRQGNGKGEHWLRDGRLWYTQKHVKNAITETTYHIKPEDVKTSDH